VLKSLEAALWAFYRSNTFEEGALLAANLGNDADTTAAIYGQLAGTTERKRFQLAGLESSPCAILSSNWRMRFWS
jgi:hypothetical protein